MALFRFSSGLDPVNALLNLQQELDRAFNNPLMSDLGLSGRGVYPPVNVFSDQEGYLVKMEAPGLKPEHLQIEAHGRTLTLRGKREEGAPQGGSFHRRERGGRDFSRSLQLPADLDLARAEASYKHGMLTVRIPKREEAKPRHITVKTA